MKNEYVKRNREKFAASEAGRFYESETGPRVSSHARIFGTEVPDVKARASGAPKFDPQFEPMAPVRRKFEDLHSEVLHGSEIVSSSLKAAIVRHQGQVSPQRRLGSEMQRQEILASDSNWASKEYLSPLQFSLAPPRQRKKQELLTSPVLELQYKSGPGPEEAPPIPPEARNWAELTGSPPLPKQAPRPREAPRRTASAKQSQPSHENWLSEKSRNGPMVIDTEYRDLMPKFEPKTLVRPLLSPDNCRRKFQFYFPPQAVSTVALKVTNVPNMEKEAMSKLIRDPELKIVIAGKDDLILREQKSINVVGSREQVEQIKRKFAERNIKVEEVDSQAHGLKKIETAKGLWGTIAGRDNPKSSFVKKVLASGAKKENLTAL